MENLREVSVIALRKLAKQSSMVAVNVAAMLLLGACGGGGGSTTGDNSAPPTAEQPIASYTLVPARVVRSAICEDEITGLGGCVGINQQAEMPRIIALNQQTQTDPTVVPFSRRTGTTGDVHTAQTATSLYEIDGRSFAQTKANSSDIGIYVNSIDRTTSIPATSVNPIYQFTTTPPAPGETDRRVMPWKDNVNRDIELSFGLLIKIMQRANEQGYAQSHPVIELIDTKSRRNFYITIGAAAVAQLPTSPEGFFVFKDFGVGNAIVATIFRDNPGFGVKLAGNEFWCNTANNTGACPPVATQFAFRLRKQDIAFVIARARTLDTALSADIADYAIDNFSFNNEVSTDGQVGLTLTNYTLSIFNR